MSRQCGWKDNGYRCHGAGREKVGSLFYCLLHAPTVRKLRMWVMGYEIN